jgi:hypothetical protein
MISLNKIKPSNAIPIRVSPAVSKGKQLVTLSQALAEDSAVTAAPDSTSKMVAAKRPRPPRNARYRIAAGADYSKRKGLIRKLCDELAAWDHASAAQLHNSFLGAISLPNIQTALNDAYHAGLLDAEEAA